MFPNILWRPPWPWAACPCPLLGAENKGQREEGGCCGDSPPPCNGVRKAEGVSPWLASTLHPSRNVKKETGRSLWGTLTGFGTGSLEGEGPHARLGRQALSEPWAKVTPQAGRPRKTQPLPPHGSHRGREPSRSGGKWGAGRGSRVTRPSWHQGRRRPLPHRPLGSTNNSDSLGRAACRLGWGRRGPYLGLREAL